uniref:Acetyl-CoA carboxylase n=1 Tax=Pinguiococcus pyrenoidosus TaxID=172671 RepID=A0A7R9U720_9STRA
MSANADELQNNFFQVQNEVPGSPMFMMQLCTNARHLEVQVIGDEHGKAVALNGRDCSTQRRFQKIFEEGPPTIAPVDRFHEMEKAAQRLVQSIGYIGAGTVEYLYNAADDKYYFLELNPRLQVEHPVTEGITQVNMPATQLQVAMGLPLDRIPDIRRFYMKDPNGPGGDIDFFEDPYDLNNHIIAARITAENPDEGFKPTSGSIERVKFQPTSNVWGYFSVGANGGIHEYADSQFGHLFAKGATREEARKNLVMALKDVEVRGEIRTTVEYLAQLLETDAFKQNTIDTSWLDGIIREKSVKVQELLDDEDIVVGAVVARAYAHIQDDEQSMLENLQKGQVSLQPLISMTSFPMELTYKDTKYIFTVTRTSASSIRLTINGRNVDATFREQSDKSLIVNWGGKQRRLVAREEPLGLRMSLDGTTVLLPTVYDPSELRTDVTGKVVRYLFEEGDEVEAGKPYVEVEAMKMIMALKASETGKIKPSLSPGSIINAGDLLASLDLKDPSKSKQISTFDGALGSTVEGSIQVESFDEAKARLMNVMDGFEDDYTSLVPQLLELSEDGATASAAVNELLNAYLHAEIPFASASSRDEAVATLIKANKETLGHVLNLGRAHVASQRRSVLAATLLRSLLTFSDRYGDVPVSDTLPSVLQQLGELPGKNYGEVALLASTLAKEMSTSPFEQRQAELRSMLLGSVDREALSVSGSLSAGVDLLASLFTDPDEAVREAAFEVYIRRVYRAHRIVDISVDPDAGEVKWSFQFRDTPQDQSPIRHGYMALVDGVSSEAVHKATSYLAGQDSGPGAASMTNVIHFAFSEQAEDETKRVQESEAVFTSAAEALRMSKVRMVNLLTPRGQEFPAYYTFQECDTYVEDPLRRDMRPTFPQLLELSRLSENFDLKRLDSVGRNVQMYLGVEKERGDAPPPGARKRPRPQAIFLRAISHSSDVLGETGAERLLLQSFDELERTLLDPNVADTVSARLFVHVLPEFTANTPLEVVQMFKSRMRMLLARHASRLINLKVDEIEVKVRVAIETEDNSPPLSLRLMASSMSGEWLSLDAYLEYPDPITGMTKQFCPIDEAEGVPGPNAMCLMEPYKTSTRVQMKRSAARRIGTTYAYDYLGLFEIDILKEWANHIDGMQLAGLTVEDTPEGVFSATELVMGADGKLSPSDRLVGTNDIGMVGWHCTMKTPEYPEGREIVIIANDVTFQSGSFGVKEDDFFYAASSYARERGIPRIYLSSNSGARIGLVEELKPMLNVAWKDPANPAQGFDYLYLTQEDFANLKPGTVVAHEASYNGATVMALDDVIGTEHGIGVENLRGSGMIAGETSRAYDEIFTLSYVSGRSVGIGAYLVRLGQRTIQMKNGPMLLTGFNALNKLLGREVYTSQDQLGGPQVMFPNGVTHQLAEDDKDGIAKIVRWLSYVPKDINSPPPRTPMSDPVDREVAWVPPPQPYDPRNFLTGNVGADGSYLAGFFDKNSFEESLAGWGKSVVVGRAKLGGIPMGVIAVETRLMEQIIPADPANPDSREAVQLQAGQVWFPDSAFKTAQAIQDFRGENLPVMIFANWRGFSGGTRDMYGEILKYGAMIVDALRVHNMPVFVYIPVNGELRGGAWVVIDPTINPAKMEMYADREARGGILEPPGICEVKFRAADQIKVMQRLDPVLKELNQELTNAPPEAADDIQAQIKEREENLLPFYTQVAIEFADLHDRSGRMQAKGVIRDTINWRNSRSYFYWRLRRRLAEDALVEKVQKAAVTSAMAEEAGAAFKLKLDGMLSTEGIYGDDRATTEWLEGTGAEKAAEAVKEVATGALQKAIAEMEARLAQL